MKLNPANRTPVKDKSYDLQPSGGSHHLCENGVPIARFDELERAEAVRARFVAEIAERNEQKKIYDTRTARQTDSTTR